MRIVTAEDVAGKLTWTAVVDAIAAGHKRTKAELGDTFLHRGGETLLSRSAWVDGLGIGVKSMSVFPGNAAIGAPTIQGGMLFFNDATGAVEALIDGRLMTYWKTAADSVFGSKLLARPDSRRLTIVGAGVVAESLVRAYREVFPGLEEIAIWNRTPARAAALADALRAEGLPVAAAEDLPAALGESDIVATCTMSKTPVVLGAWVRPGTHLDLIGAFKSDMREIDDALLLKARLFVDSRDTTLGHIGEVQIPIDAGVITAEAVLGDLYDLVGGHAGRTAADEITVFKNGGGAHLDLMTARAILDAV